MDSLKNVSAGTDALDRRVVLLDLIGKLRDLADVSGFRVSRESLEGAERVLSAGRFQVVVLGGFKRGKSTLINSLVGASILPMGVPPLTSVITKLSYGQSPKVEVHFEQGGCSPADTSALESYVTERGNPGNEKGVAEVDIFFPADLLRDGVVIIDTPGVGSTYAQSNKVAYGFLPNVDAAIFVFGADSPISQMEVEFLNEIKGNTERIFFVQNKVDKTEPSERLESLAFSESLLRRAMSHEVRIYPMSARLALEAKLSNSPGMLAASGYLDFEQALREFLSTSRRNAELSLTALRVQKVAQNMQAAAQMERKMIDEPLETVNKQIALMRNELDMAKQRLADMDALIEGRISRMLEQFTDDLTSRTEKAKADLMSDLEKYLESIPPTVKRGRLASLVDHHISEAIQNCFGPIARSAGDEITRWLRSAAIDILEEVERVSRKLEGRTVEIFGVESWAPYSPKLSLEGSRFYFDEVMIFKCESIVPAEWPMILPSRLLRKHIGDKARATMLNELEKHSGRLRSDVDYRLSEGSRLLKAETRARLMGLMESIEHALADGIRSREATKNRRDARLKELADFQVQLTEISTKLQVQTA